MVDVKTYPDVDQLLKQQVFLGNQLTKEVWLDGISETKVLKMDSTSWSNELSFLQEINPNQTEYIGAFSGSELPEGKNLTLGKKEKGSLKNFSYIKRNGKITSINAIIHEDKDVYVHHKEVNVRFKDDRITNFQIDGYQKIMLKDTIRFRVIGSVDD